MQVIILAAGMGRRLGKYTEENTKCMLEVNGVRLIDRLLGQLERPFVIKGQGSIPKRLPLNRVIIVMGYKGDNLKRYLQGKYESLNIEFADNPIYDRTNNIYSLSIVKEKMCEDDTLLFESDLVFSDNLIPMIVNCGHQNAALVAKYETWMDGTMVLLDKDNNIVNFVPRKAFDYDNVNDYYKTVNIYRFSKDFSTNVYVPFLEAYTKALGNNEYYEQVLRVITQIEGADFRAVPIGGEKWYEIDDLQDLDIAETIFSNTEDLLPKYLSRYGGYWRFPQMLDYCYLVNPYFPTQRMKDEMRANFDILLTEYPSGMKVNSLLAGKYFGVEQDYIAVGNGAAELIKSVIENSDGKIGITIPTFEEYVNRKDKNDVVAFAPGNRDFSYTADELMAFFSDKDISMLLVVNPDNPSGNFIEIKDILRIADWCAERNIRFVVDESFVDFSDGYAHNSLLDNKILEEHKNMFVMKSISKSYGVPGLRLGIIASADEKEISRIKKDVSIWNINSFAEFYMQIFNKYVTFYREACADFVAERRHLEEGLRSVPFLRVIPTQANFFLCEVTGDISTSELTMKLLSGYNILIKDCSKKLGMTGRKYIRLAIRDTKDNDRLIAAMQSINDEMEQKA